MTSRHTPGPWKVGTKGQRAQPYVEGADGSPVASCGGNAPGRGSYEIETLRRRKANARLIAAAPTMIDALRDLVIAAEAAGWDTDVLNAPILDAARAALAKTED